MAESIDAWYERELAYLRSAGAEFAARYAKIADRLSLSATGTQDPHVERLLQGVAFLNARIRQKLDDSFPELVESMLGVLYPHLISPVPSTSILQMSLNPKQVDLIDGYPVPRGTMLESERIDGFGAFYQTCFSLDLYPLQITKVELVVPPFKGPLGSASRDVESALHIQIRPISPEQTMGQYSFEQLQFFVDVGSYQLGARLMELLLTQCHEVVIGGNESQSKVALLGPDCFSQAGFEDNEALLPQNSQSFPGYRLLAEHFVLREKSLFFNFSGFTKDLLEKSGKTLDVWIYLTDYDADLAAVINQDSLKLGCTPIINLFEETSDAIPVAINHSEYRIIPDARAEHVNEVYSINQVTVGDDDDSLREFYPFYSVSHSTIEKPHYWHSVRRPGPQARDAGPIDGPSEVFIRLVDQDYQLLAENSGYLQTRVTCFNRLIPEQLSKRELSQVRFTFVDGGGPVSTIRCLVSPTRTIRRHLGVSSLWPLVSQLSLNHHSLANGEGGIALKEILKLNDPRQSTQVDRLIDGLIDITSQPCVERIGSSFVRGTHIHIVLDEESFSGDSAYIFCCVLNRFLSMAASINSFTKLTATTNEAFEKGIPPWSWTPRTGNRLLV